MNTVARWQLVCWFALILAATLGCGGAEDAPATTAQKPGAKLPIEVEKGPEDALPKQRQNYQR